MNKTQISVIVPAYNCERTIRQTLEAIKSQIGDLKTEIIVVDDGSTDSTSEIVASISGIKLLQQKNSGPATARNTGAWDATGSILVFTDSDTIPHHDWLINLTAPFTDSSIVATAGTYTIANPINRLSQLIQKEIENRHSSYRDFIVFAGTYNLAVRKELFAKIKGFDESYRHASGEDNDLCYRIAAMGHKIRYVANAKVAHHHPEKLTGYLKSQFRHGFWRAKLYISHPTKLSGDSYTGTIDAAEVILCLAFYAAAAFKILGMKNFFANIALITTFFANTVLELFHGLTVSTSAESIVYAAGVFYLRALARSAGLLFGILHFCRKLPQGHAVI